ncbi:MAG: YggS family pyridoxal phosphate-dependent enzyme [Planctomycetes bacterium]|nr:YggS family pyridoxal phosphate-dependent enzyme [Planctomycetota bacterium]
MQELRDETKARLADSLARVRERIAAAHARAGRRDPLPRLVAVTKKRSPALIEALLEFGVDAIGENRPEEILRKEAEMGRAVPWHMIGHFQRKKIARALPSIKMVHSVHSVELLSALDHRLIEIDPEGPPLPVLIQVNVAVEASKQGFDLAEARDAADIAAAFPRLDCRGFMTMAPFEAAESELRRIFAALRELRDGAGPERFPELSMGMSDDYEIAVEEGATMLRIGSALFDGMDEDR